MGGGKGKREGKIQILPNNLRPFFRGCFEIMRNDSGSFQGAGGAGRAGQPGGGSGGGS